MAFALDNGAAETLLEGYNFGKLRIFRPGYIYPGVTLPNITAGAVRFHFDDSTIFTRNTAGSISIFDRTLTLCIGEKAKNQYRENSDDSSLSPAAGWQVNLQLTSRMLQ